MTILTERFTHAVDYARVAHASQVRKGTRIPYLSHLLAVATLVIEHGGNEDQAIAGLLHDTIEDCGHAHEAAIPDRFGDAVAEIVLACTDGTAEAKSAPADAEARRRDWEARKQAYLAHLAEARTTSCWCPPATSCTTPAPSCATWKTRRWDGPCSRASPAAWTARSGTTARWPHCSRRAAAWWRGNWRAPCGGWRDWPSRWREAGDSGDHCRFAVGVVM